MRVLHAGTERGVYRLDAAANAVVMRSSTRTNPVRVGVADTWIATTTAAIMVATMGGQPGTPGAGKSTGCHLHFEVIGARNPFAN